MAENKKTSFEDRLINWAGVENVKAAKQLLKGSSLSGVWRDGKQNLRGYFQTPDGAVFTTVIAGTVPTAKCDCSSHDESTLCRHACAVIMYAGRFGNPTGSLPPEVPPNYYRGLKQESWQRLAERAPEVPSVQLLIEAQSEAPHAPSKWEDITVSVRINSKERSFPGNLNNLRQLYFDKSLSVVIQYDNFDLQEQQIIRFLALYGEPDGSKINLCADMTAEFFHCLIDYPRFFKGGQQIKIRGDRAEVAVVKNANKYYPALRIAGALLPVSGAKVISGRSGCWIGAGGEYFFVSANCEVGFLRNFFRSGTQTSGKDGISEERVKRLPFPVVNLKDPEPQIAPLQILLDAVFSGSDTLTLDVKYIYHIGNGVIAAPVKSGELVASGYRFYRRDSAKERAFEQQLAMFGFTFEGGLFILRGSDKAGLFFEYVLPDMLNGNCAPAVAPGLFKLSSMQPITLKCSHAGLSGDSHKVSYRISAGNIQLDWNELFEASKKFSNYIRKAGAIFRIPDKLAAFFRAAPSMLKSVDTEKEEFIVPHCNTAFFVEMTKSLPEASVPEFFIPVNPVSISENNSIRKFSFSGTLRSYQQKGVDFLSKMTDLNYNVVLADEMGLGKTIQLLALLGKKLHEGSQPALIICPASLITNWAREAEKFLPGVRVIAPEGNDRKIIWKSPESYDIAILSYAAARIAGDKLKPVNFSYLVLDEAQHIKNPGSENAKNCKGIIAAHRIVLSGTPLENSPEDLWSIFDFLHPGMLGSAASFKKRYVSCSSSAELHNELACRISPFMLRRTKKEVAGDLPERTEKIIYCDFSPEQRALYDSILEEGRKELSECGSDRTKGNAAIFNTLLKLRQVCCAPALLADGRGNDLPSAKEDLLHELVNEIVDSSHKLLIFSQFTSMLKRMTPVMAERKINYEYLDGSTKNRQERVDKFNKSPEIPLFLLSLKAGGTGLNLTSADTVIIYDPWWNPAAELQAADRTHRIGQDKPVTIYKLVVRDSIEEKILALQGRKRELFNQVVEASQDDSAKLSIEELRELLEK